MDKNILRDYLNKFNVSELRTLVRYFDKQFAGSCKAGSSCKSDVTKITEWLNKNTSNHSQTISDIQKDTTSTDKNEQIIQLYIDTVKKFCQHHEYREYEMEFERRPCPGVIAECKSYIYANTGNILEGKLTNTEVTDEITKIIINSSQDYPKIP